MTDATLDDSPAVTRPRASSALYRAVWRWHFYAGLYVVPFLLMLAVTGLIMVYFNSIETRFGERSFVSPSGDRASFAVSADLAVAAIPGGTLKQVIVPASPDRADLVTVDKDGAANFVAVDPYARRVVDSVVKDDTWFYFANKIHGTLLIGNVGDRLIEIAAGFGIVLIVTGLYLWWPRGERRLSSILVPNLAARGRALWKELHLSVGFYVSIVLLFFLISGMSWAGIWGGKFVQAWSTFPAAKWDNIPLSDKTHASMNHGALHEVPWGLEQTPMPASGSQAGSNGITAAMPVTLDSVVAFARSIGFDGQFRVNVPVGENGVYTVSADSMDGDTTNPMGDRTVHIDQYTGKILAEIGFADYSLGAKSMAVGIALHQGDLGWWNTLLNALFCLSVIFLCVSGIAMWWIRRPIGTFRLAPPPMPADMPLWKGAVLVTLFLSLAFPLVGLTLIAVLALDGLIVSRVPRLRAFLG